MSLRHASLAALTSAALVFAAGTEASADTFKFRIGAGHPYASSWVASIKDYFIPRVTERVKAETGHTLEWTEAWGGSVCKIGECLEAVESGLLDIADLQTPFEPTKLLPFNFTYFVPFGSPDPRLVAKTAMTVVDQNPAMTKYLETKYNQVFIGLGPIGNYGLVTTFPWKDVGELKGHKVAAAGPNIPWLEGTGIVSVQSNLVEAYTSFQTGVYEGWIMYPDGIMSFKLNEVTKQFVDIDFGAIATTILTMNKDVFDELPPAVQKIFREVGREWATQLGEISYQRNLAAVGKMKDGGMEVRRLDDAGKVTWAKQLPNLPKARAAEIEKQGLSGDIVYSYIKALKAAGHTFPRDWEAER